MSYHTIQEAREVLAETAAIMAQAQERKASPVAAVAHAKVAGSPKAKTPPKPTWPQAVASLAKANNWTKARAASELEKMPGGAELRQEFVAAQNAIARKEREIVILRGRQSAARAAVAAR